MGVISATLVCNICEKKFSLRYQVDSSFMEQVITITFGCSCGNIIKGDNSNSNFNFPGYEIINDFIEGSEAISLSAQLPIVKDIIYQPRETIFMLTPFMSLLSFGNEAIGKHSGHINTFLKEIYPHKDIYPTMFNMVKTNNLDALSKYVKKTIKSDITFDNQIEAFNYFIELLKITFYNCHSIGYKEFFHERYYLPIENYLNAQSSTTLQALRNEIESKWKIKDELYCGTELIIKCIPIFHTLFPCMFLSEIEDYEKEYSNDLYITTTDYDSIKDLYIDCFEFLSRISSLFVGISNMKSNCSKDLFPAPNTNYDMVKYVNLTNGKKKEVISTYPSLNQYYLRTLDNEIRNGIGHNKTHYNAYTQIITYYYNDRRPDAKKEISLIDFSFILYQQILKVFESLFLLNVFEVKSNNG